MLLRHKLGSACVIVLIHLVYFGVICKGQAAGCSLLWDFNNQSQLSIIANYTSYLSVVDVGFVNAAAFPVSFVHSPIESNTSSSLLLSYHLSAGEAGNWVQM